MKKTYISPNVVFGKNEISHSVICASYDFNTHSQSGPTGGGNALGDTGMGYGGEGDGGDANDSKRRGFYEGY